VFVSLCTLWPALATQPLATQPCRSARVENPEGNYFIPGTLGAITFREVAGLELKLDAYIQPGSTRRPGILVVHGGGWTSGSRIAFVGQLLETLTEAGFNWFSIDYRLAPGEKHPAATEDLAAALEFVRCNADFFKIDPDRLAIVAEDSGVQSAFLLASQKPERVAAIVGLGGFYNLSTLPFFDEHGNFELVFGPVHSKDEQKSRLRAASPIRAVNKDHPPALLIHGSLDTEVPIEQARAYCEAVKEEGSTCNLIEVQNRIHRPENWLPSQWAYKARLTDWLKEVLKPVPPVVPPDVGNGPLRKNLVYGSYDDSAGRAQDLLMDAYLPESDEPATAIILAHGGGWEAGNKVTYLTPVLEPLARAGFAWFSIDYRLTPEYRNWNQLEDLRRAVRYIRAHASDFNINPLRIGILGESASGQMVTQTAALPCPGNPESDDPVERESCEVQAVVSFYGVYDFLPMVKDASPRSFAQRLFGRTSLDDETRSILRQYSPYHQIHSGLPPILLINGTNEFLWEQAEAFAERLGGAGVEYDLIRLEGAPHGMENWEGHAEWQFYKQEMVDWLKKKLR